jgi:hypothetical protein
MIVQCHFCCFAGLAGELTVLELLALKIKLLPVIHQKQSTNVARALQRITPNCTCSSDTQVFLKATASSWESGTKMA